MSDERKAIGTMTARNVEATLYDDGVWNVSAFGRTWPGMSGLFALEFGTGAEDGPADGLPGSRSLHAAAEEHGGTVAIVSVPPEPGGEY